MLIQKNFLNNFVKESLLKLPELTLLKCCKLNESEWIKIMDGWMDGRIDKLHVLGVIVFNLASSNLLLRHLHNAARLFNLNIDTSFKQFSPNMVCNINRLSCQSKELKFNSHQKRPPWLVTAQETVQQPQCHCETLTSQQQMIDNYIISLTSGNQADVLELWKIYLFHLILTVLSWKIRGKEKTL